MLVKGGHLVVAAVLSRYTMSWYEATSVDAAVLAIPYEDARWVPANIVVLSDGKQTVRQIVRIDPAAGQSFLVLSDAHQIPNSAKVSWRIATSEEQSQGYVSQASAAPSAAGAYPAMPDEVEMGAVYAPPAPAAYDDVQKPTATTTSPYGEQHQDNYASTSYGSNPSYCMCFCNALLFFIVSCGLMVANAEICMAIGLAKNWLSVLAWLLLGVPVLTGIAAFLLYKAMSCCEDFSSLLYAMIVWPIFFFIFALSFGTPYAMIWGQQGAATTYLAAGSTTSVGCYRNGGANITSVGSYQYITLEDPTWRLEVMPYEQKMSVIADTNDDDVLQGYHEFCAAHLKWTGSVPCRTDNLYAICYQHAGTATPLRPCDVAACGWNMPPNAVYLRPINTNEEFYRVIETSEEADFYTNTVNKEAANSVPSYSRVPVVFAGDGPDAMAAILAANTTLIAVMRGLIYGLWFAFSFLYALLVARWTRSGN